jgi:ribosomal protein S18 acetylase RimI-like enzyme
MTIKYRDTREFESDCLRDLFLSVIWGSGRNPERLQCAIRNSDRVYSAWDGDRLVGLVNAFSDGALTAYIHYLLVHPEYQRQGIGKQLLTLMLDHYRNFHRMVLVSESDTIDFYRKCGFVVGEKAFPMYRTNDLETQEDRTNH